VGTVPIHLLQQGWMLPSLIFFTAICSFSVLHLMPSCCRLLRLPSSPVKHMWSVFLNSMLSIMLNPCSHTQNSLYTHLKPPNSNMTSVTLLDHLYYSNWKTHMNSLMSEARIFGLTMFGDGATIKTCPLINILAAGVNNPFALLDVADCTNHVSAEKKRH
jgi:hypothetical protein